MNIDLVLISLKLAQAIVEEWSKSSGKTELTEADFEALRLEDPKEILRKLKQSNPL